MLVMKPPFVVGSADSNWAFVSNVHPANVVPTAIVPVVDVGTHGIQFNLASIGL